MNKKRTNIRVELSIRRLTPLANKAQLTFSFFVMFVNILSYIVSTHAAHIDCVHLI